MKILSLFAFFAFIIYLYLCVYTYRLDSKSRLNIVFSVLCANFAVWAFAYTFFYSAPDKATAWFWYKISTIGWSFFPGIALHFFTILTEKEWLLKKWWAYPVFYAPGLAFTVKALTGTLLVQDFVQSGLGWCEIAPPDSIWFWAYPVYYTSYLLGGFSATVRWGNRSLIQRKKKQARVIGISGFPVLILTAVTDSIMPALGLHILPSIASVSVIVWIFGVWYSIVKYKLMILTPSIAAEEIISKMLDLLVLVNPDGNIIKVNLRTNHLLGYGEGEIIGKPVNTIISGEHFCKEDFFKIKEDLYHTHNYELHYKTKGGDEIPVNISCSAMKDREGDVIGVVIVGQDIRQMKQLKQEIAERRRAEETLRAAEAKFRSLVEQSLAGIYIIQDKKFMYVNPKFAEIFGYTQDELLASRSVLDIVAEDSRELVAHNIAAYLQEEASSIYYALSGRRKDGSLINIETHGTKTEFNNKPAIIGTLLDVTERKQLEETIRHQAYHDTLTGLPNRMLFNDHLTLSLAQASRNKGMLSVLFLDLDGFKAINDSLGHAVGDELLRNVAHRLLNCLREGDTVARIGGDEYTLLLPHVSAEEDAAKVAEKILAALEHHFIIDDHKLSITGSIGIGIYPKDGEHAEILLKNADTAMYYAKEQGKNNYKFYNTTMNLEILELKALEESLRLAIEREELVVYYQPQLCVTTRQIIGIEALVRWNHPELGLLHPRQFMHIAERTGLIIPLSEWVLRRACAQNKTWQDAGYPAIRVAVNLSTAQLQQPNFIAVVDDVLHETGLSPDLLELEITESIAMQNIEVTISKLRKITDRGIQLALDDFGTGYSSLTYLKKLPIHTVKIDKSFIHELSRNPGDSAIVSAVIAMAQNLNLTTIAEGVETLEQVAFLRTHKCDKMQGYLLSRPLPTSEFERILSEEGFFSAKRLRYDIRSINKGA